MATKKATCLPALLLLVITPNNGSALHAQEHQQRQKGELKLDLSAFASGVYAYTVKGNKGTLKTGKLIIAR